MWRARETIQELALDMDGSKEQPQMTVHGVTTPQSTAKTPDIVARLERRVQDMVAAAERSEMGQILAHPDTPPERVAAIIKYVLLEVFSYGPLVTEATFRAIGRMPNTRLDLMRPMVSHLMSEVVCWPLGTSVRTARAAPVDVQGHRKATLRHRGYPCPVENHRGGPLMLITFVAHIIRVGHHIAHTLHHRLAAAAKPASTDLSWLVCLSVRGS